MNLLPIFLNNALILLVALILLWLLSLALKNASIVDIVWGMGFVALAWLTYAQIGTPSYRSLLINGLVTLWGLRLAGHIFLRNRTQPEDFRYAAWREEYGKIWWIRSLFHVFLLQGLLMWLIAFPVMAAPTNPAGGSPHPLDWVALPLWAFGFFFEAVGDWQLANFKKNPQNKGKLLTTGLWKYSRHPNYFGDAAQWWAFYLLALPAGAGWTLFSPLLMTYLLLRVSGVSMLEKTMSIRPGYEEYTRRTSAFLPLPPKKQ